MTRASDTILDQAAAWHAASSHDSMDWDGFTAWLEADHRHASAYDEVALADAALSQHGAALDWGDDIAPRAANDDADAVPLAARIARRRWFGGVLAASLVAVLAVPQFLQQGPTVYKSGAAPLEVALEDGSQVLLAPRSKLEISGEGQDRIALEGGAWFDIRHRPSRTLAITAGGLTISDIGTRFDIQASSRQLRVEVEDGEVSVAGPVLSAPLRLVRGRALSFDPAAGTAWINGVSQADIGEWRSGRLTYESAPLSLVASDLSRYAGINLDLGNAIADRTFSGTLVIGNGARAVQDLARLMELGVRSSDGRYRLDEQR